MTEKRVNIEPSHLKSLSKQSKMPGCFTLHLVSSPCAVYCAWELCLFTAGSSRKHRHVHLDEQPFCRQEKQTHRSRSAQSWKSDSKRKKRKTLKKMQTCFYSILQIQDKCPSHRSCTNS